MDIKGTKLAPTVFLSPGNNPFDDLWKKTTDAVCMSEQVNRRSSIRLSADFSNRKSLSFCDLNASDFGRESMGILPPDFGRDSLGFMNMNINQRSPIRPPPDPSHRKSLPFCDLNANDFGRESMGILPSDFGRDSLGFMNINSLETERESLGIIQINALRESLSFRGENLGILNFQDLGRESLEAGRESLGILYLKSPDVKFGNEEKRIPDIMLTTIEEDSPGPTNVLETAFLQTYSRKSSALSSSSSINPSFNSLSLEGPSRIYSISSLRNFKDTASIYSNSSGPSSIHSPLNKAKIFSPSELNMRSRIQSVPSSLQTQFSPLYENMQLGNVTERKFWSADRTTDLKSLDRRSFCEALDFKEVDLSIEFHDSVFIEGHAIAEKFADGSILNESSVGEVGLLDCTPQPDWPDVSNTDNKSNDYPKCDTETIFKTVDKMLPPPLSNTSKNSKTDRDTSNENVEKMNGSEQNHSKISQTAEQNVSKLLHNISDIQHETRKPSGSGKDPKEILANLSELLNCTNPSDTQKSEGKKLLNSLADILGETRSSVKSSLDDSGHSSTNEQSGSPNKEDHELYEVLDLRIKSTDEHASKESSCTNGGVLDLSLKSKPIENLIGKRLSQSLSSSNPNIKLPCRTEKRTASASSLEMSKNRTSNSSLASNDSKNASNPLKPQISGKLRQKHFSSSLKKGPMKAIIPVGDMKKKSNVLDTPEKNMQMTSKMQSKRTSTPINEPKLKPIAASTPTARPLKETPRPSKTGGDNGTPSSGMKKVNSSSAVTRDRAYSSTCSLNEASKLRRNSVSDVKKPPETLRRRNSVETASGIMSSVTRVRQTIGSPYRYQKQNSGIESKPLTENKGKSVENKHLPVARSSNLISKLKRPGKENIVKSELKSNANKKSTPDKQKQSVSTAESSSKSIPSPKIPASSPSQKKTRMGLCDERRSSIHAFGGNVKNSVTKRNSIANKSGILSGLAKIRQNILESPYFVPKTENLNKNVLSDNGRLDKSSGIRSPQLKKTGKENTEN